MAGKTQIIQSVESDMSAIRLSRKSNLVYCVRKFGVFIDGQKIGSIGNGQTETFQVAPGRHRMFMKVSWCKSKEFEFDIASGDTKEMECGTPLGLWYVALVTILVCSVMFTHGLIKFGVSMITFVLGIIATIATFQPDRYVYLKERTDIRTI